MHAAESGHRTSLHITLGLIAYSWSEFVGQCLGELALRSRRWRDNLPFGFGAQEEAGFEELRRELVTRLVDLSGELDVGSVLSARLDDVQGAFRPCASNYLAQASAVADSLTSGALVRRRPNVRCRTKIGGGRVIVIAAGRELDFPSVAADTVKLVLSGEPRTAGSIDDCLDWPGRKAVLSTMIREGIVEIIPVKSVDDRA